MDTRLPSERGRGFRPTTNGGPSRREEIFAYDLQAFGGCGAPVIVTESLQAGSGIYTVFLRKLNGTGLRHVVGSPEGTLEEARGWVEARIADGRYARWTEEQQRQARAAR